MKSILAALLVIAVSAVLTLSVIAVYVFSYRPNGNGTIREVRVDQGDSMGLVTRKLRAQKLIGNEKLFLLWARLTGVEKRIHLGLYRFETPVTASEILDRLATGKGVFNKVTIPEGLTVKEIAGLLEQMQIASSEKFLTEAFAPELLDSLGLRDQGIEGYLFPSTYYFAPATPEKKLVHAMVEQFRKATSPVLKRLEPDESLTPHELVTLASIIEKETGIEAERPLVSAVFHNRLKLKMPLQSDPTVIYGLKNFQGNLTRKDLQDPSPYNTYRISGLPPGPICNPGLSSIKAALEPADVPYLYFVSKNDGSHQFSENLKEHNRAVNVYQPVAVPASRQRNFSRAR